MLFILKKSAERFAILKESRTFALAITQKNKGSLAEWLGTGLQNRLRQFDSARNL